MRRIICAGVVGLAVGSTGALARQNTLIRLEAAHAVHRAHVAIAYQG